MTMNGAHAGNNRKLIDHIFFNFFDDIDTQDFQITSVNLPFILFLFTRTKT